MPSESLSKRDIGHRQGAAPRPLASRSPEQAGFREKRSRNKLGDGKSGSGSGNGAGKISKCCDSIVKRKTEMGRNGILGVEVRE